MTQETENAALARRMGRGLASCIEWRAKLDGAVLRLSAEGDAEPHENKRVDDAVMQSQEATAELLEVIDAIGADRMELWAIQQETGNPIYQKFYSSAIRDLVAANHRFGSGESFRNGEGISTIAAVASRLAFSSSSVYVLEGLFCVLNENPR